MIELKNVSYTYPNTVQPALHQITLSLEKGRCIMVTGPSGAGKTSLCLAASGILHHEYGGKKEGSVVIDGKDVTDYSSLSDLAQNVGVVFDDPEAQMIFTTVEEEILSALEHRGLSAAVIEERLAGIMKTTYLEEIKDRSPHNLSGGQKQRVALAATLALGNDVLILDEPTSELDEHATKRIADILMDLKEQGKTILLIEHKFSHFRKMVDTLIIIENGRITSGDVPDAVLSDDRVRGMVLPDFSMVKKNARGVITSEPVISVQNLSYRYGVVQALSGISLTIRKGEFVAIAGENGSGKTTLVKHFNRLLSPTTGDVIVNGKNTKECSIAALASDVGLVFQNPDHMFFADTVREEIAYGVKNIGIENGDAVIDAALRDAGLTESADLYPRWLSRGERQRLGIACVVAMQPSVIVLDEPTTGLDGYEALLVIDLLKKLQEKGHTIIIITHNREIAKHCADRIITMENGKIISDTVGE
ncbi:MAG: energy-coupling factor transporter ATPase [Methanoregula sp.]|nr:energy-coupling factor transporter ATPase [Methanoregula sp.]